MRDMLSAALSLMSSVRKSKLNEIMFHVKAQGIKTVTDFVQAGPMLHGILRQVNRGRGVMLKDINTMVDCATMVLIKMSHQASLLNVLDGEFAKTREDKFLRTKDDRPIPRSLPGLCKICHRGHERGETDFCNAFLEIPNFRIGNRELAREYCTKTGIGPWPVKTLTELRGPNRKIDYEKSNPVRRENILQIPKLSKNQVWEDAVENLVLLDPYEWLKLAIEEAATHLEHVDKWWAARVMDHCLLFGVSTLWKFLITLPRWNSICLENFLDEYDEDEIECLAESALHMHNQYIHHTTVWKIWKRDKKVSNNLKYEEFDIYIGPDGERTMGQHLLFSDSSDESSAFSYKPPVNEDKTFDQEQGMKDLIDLCGSSVSSDDSTAPPGGTKKT